MKIQLFLFLLIAKGSQNGNQHGILNGNQHGILNGNQHGNDLNGNQHGILNENSNVNDLNGNQHGILNGNLNGNILNGNSDDNNNLNANSDIGTIEDVEDENQEDDDVLVNLGNNGNPNPGRRLSHNDYADMMDKMDDIVVKKDMILKKRDENNPSPFWTEIKSLSSEIIVAISDNLTTILILLGYNILGITCNPTWGEYGDLPRPDDFLCNVAYYLLALRLTFYVAFIFPALSWSVKDSFDRSYLFDSSIKKSALAKKFYNSTVGLYNHEKNCYRSVENVYLCDPRTWLRIKPDYVSMQFYVVLNTIGYRIIFQYMMYAGWASLFYFPVLKFSDIYTYITIPSIAQLVLGEVLLGFLMSCQCSKNHSFTKGVRRVVDVVNLFNKMVNKFLQWFIYDPADKIGCMHESFGSTQKGLRGQAYMLMQDNEDYYVNCDLWEYFKSFRWLKEVGHGIQDSYFGLATLHALHTIYGSRPEMWVIIFLLNLAYMKLTDKERVWYLRWFHQVSCSVSVGYYSFLSKAMPSTFLSLIVPGAIIRGLIGVAWYKDLFFKNAQDLWGTKLTDYTGEALVHNIFNGLSHPATDTLTGIKNITVVVLGVFSIMGMIFPDPKTPFGRLLTKYKKYGGFFTFFFTSVSAILVTLSYYLFLYLNANPITTGGTHDLHFMYFYSSFMFARLVLDGAVATWHYDEFQKVFEGVKRWWRGNSNQVCNLNELQEKLVVEID